MTAKELIKELKKHPDGTHVYIYQNHSGVCALTEGVEYSDTMSDADSEDDSNMTDGIILTSTCDLMRGGVCISEPCICSGEPNRKKKT